MRGSIERIYDGYDRIPFFQSSFWKSTSQINRKYHTVGLRRYRSVGMSRIDERHDN
jgi:hypothetical protein